MKRIVAMLEPVRAAFRGDQFRPTIVLLASPVLMVTWWHYGSREFFADWVVPRLSISAESETIAAASAIYYFAMCFLLLGIVPALIVKFVFRQRLTDYGVTLGDRAITARLVLVWAPIFVVVAYLSSFDSSIRDMYPLNRVAGSTPKMFGLHACTYALFYLGWEFHFRGFLQFGLREKLGDANALLVQVMASTLLHFGRPGAEVYASIAGGILWGMFAFRTRSLLAGLLQHFLLGIMLDYFICYR